MYLDQQINKLTVDNLTANNHTKSRPTNWCENCQIGRYFNNRRLTGTGSGRPGCEACAHLYFPTHAATWRKHMHRSSACSANTHKNKEI